MSPPVSGSASAHLTRPTPSQGSEPKAPPGRDLLPRQCTLRGCLHSGLSLCPLPKGWGEHSAPDFPGLLVRSCGTPDLEWGGEPLSSCCPTFSDPEGTRALGAPPHSLFPRRGHVPPVVISSTSSSPSPPTSSLPLPCTPSPEAGSLTFVTQQGVPVTPTLS